MPKSKVEVAARTLEVYEVEADNEDEARENWSDGELLSHDDEALDIEVLSVKPMKRQSSADTVSGSCPPHKRACLRSGTLGSRRGLGGKSTNGQSVRIPSSACRTTRAGIAADAYSTLPRVFHLFHPSFILGQARSAG
jgi:hypothetical protein